MVPTEAVLVISPHAGRSRKLAHARRALDRDAVVVAEELEIEHLDRLPELLCTPDGKPRLVIAAGGDGTVGSVAGHLAGAENPLGILPLGTGNDFARSLDIPLNPRRAARLLGTGEISRVDLGRITRPGGTPRYFAHGATVWLNVDFAKLATRASVRGRLGRLTYLAAAVYAVRERTTVEDVSPPKMLRAGLFLLLGINRTVPGVRALQVERLGVDSSHPLGLPLDGELDGNLPGQFEAIAGALRVVVPRS